MKTLKAGIASYDEMKARTMRIARGEQAVAADDPTVWFVSTASFAKLLSAANRELLHVIAEQAPGSLEELARITGRQKSNLSRTLHRLESCGLIRMQRGAQNRLVPRPVADRIELALPLTRPALAAE